jgi:mono/diheme cytochrome c family protein
MKILKIVLILAALAITAAAALVWFGAYNVAADKPHWPLTHILMESVRERSIAVRARRIEVPAGLDHPDRVRRGAGNYDAMCVGCHLKPGMQDSEIRKGIYPKPPNLAEPSSAVVAERFWVIKHGIKMSAMPAWGKAGVDDETIWNLVALLQKLPEMSAEEYKALVAESEGHSHARAEAETGEEGSRHAPGKRDGHEHGAQHPHN